MNLDSLKETIIATAKRLSTLTGSSPEDARRNSTEITDLLLQHWATGVPEIYRPKGVDLTQVFKEADAIERLIAPLEWYITGSPDPKELLAKLKHVCPAPELCGKVFKGGEPVYSCRDCGLDGTCVLCVDCFKNSEHKNHRYRICTSSSGYCDCEAWNAHPTCSLHAKTLNNDAFVSLLGNIMTSIEFEQLLARLRIIFQFVLDYSYVVLKWPRSNLPPELKPKESEQQPKQKQEDGSDVPNVEDFPKNQYCSVLYNDETHTYEHVIFALTKSIRCDAKQATEFATAVDREGRCIIAVDDEARCEAIATQIGDITKKNSDKKLEVKVVHADMFAHQTFATRLMQWMSSILPICEQFRTIFAAHLYTGVHQSAAIKFVDDDICAVTLLEKVMLSDIFFWKSIRVQWHQLFMCGLLLDLETKKQFSRLFTRNYPALIRDYMRDDHEHRVSILCLSVQIYTVPSIIMMLIEQENIIELLIDAFLDINHNFHIPTGKFKFDPLLNLYPFRRSYQLLSDLHYIVSKPPDVWNDRLRQAFCIGVESFVKLIKRMQLMDSVVRQVNQHIEYEPGWETGINFQMKLAPIMKSMVEWTGADEAVYVRCLNAAVHWFRLSFNSANRHTNQKLAHAAGHAAYCWNYDVTKKEVSIHMPLIRFIGALLVHTSKFGINYAEDVRLFPDRPSVDTLIELPLRTQVMIGQFRAGMWRRNGYSLINQVMFYFNVRLRDEMFDRDVTMLQVGAALMDPNEYLIHLLNKFNLLFLLDEANQHQRPTNDELIRQTNTVIEEFFRLIYMILTERFVPGLGAVTAEDCIKREAIQWLCKDSMSNSDLLNHLSDDSDMNLEDIILEIADFKKPTNPTKYGKYVLKDEYYKDYNPFFYHYARQDQSAAYEAQLRRRKTKKEKYICCPPPPLPDFVAHFSSINQILLSDVMFALIKTVLEKTCDLNDNIFTDSQFQQVLYVCGIGLQEEQKHPRDFRFSSKCIDHGIVQLLERCNSRHILPRIEMHKDLLTWLFDKFKEVFQMQSAAQAAASDFVMVDAPSDAQEGAESFLMSTRNLTEAQRKEEEDLKARRKEMAAARKNRILAQMNAMQKTFMKENAEYFKEDDSSNSSSNLNSMNSGSLMDISQLPQISEIAVGVQQDHRTTCTTTFTDTDFFTCILCLEQHNINSAERFLLLGAFVQKSTVLSQNRSKQSWIDGNSAQTKDTKEPLKNICFVESDLNYGPHVNTCTHYMHNDCFEKYLEMIGIQERRRASGRHTRVSYDINKGEFLCPLCECLCNIAIPIVPQVALKQASLKTDIPMEKFLSGLNSILADSGCDGSTGWLDTNKYSETYSGYKKPFAELIQFLPSDIRQYFQDIQSEYRENLQQDSVAANDVLKVPVRRKLVLNATKAAFVKIFGSSQEPNFSPESSDPLQSLYWATSFTIHTLERLIRTERTTFADMIDTRPYHCLKSIISLVRSQMCTYSFAVPRKLFLYLTNYLLVQSFYQSSPYSVLELDAFSLLVTLLCTSGALFAEQDNTNATKKFTILLGNSADKNLIELMLTFHLVQIILTNADSLADEGNTTVTTRPRASTTNEEEAMDVDDSDASSLPSTPLSVATSSDQNLVQFMIDVLLAAGHQFNETRLKSNAGRVASAIRGKLIPFLRCTAIYAHFLTDVKLPKRLLDNSITGASTSSAPTLTQKLTSTEEYELLCQYLGIPAGFAYLRIPYLRGVALFWTRHSRIRPMFVSSSQVSAEVSVSSTSQSQPKTSATSLLPELRFLLQPHPINRLYPLPHDYSDLINSVAHFTCPNSKGEESRFPTMCLVCGEILCSQNYCCQKRLKREMIGACTYHAQFCGAGTGIFLRIRDCKILLLATRGRGCYLPSPYVDKYGETDQGLIRGGPLYLSESAYENLYKLWLRHGIPEQIVHLLESSTNLSATNWNIM